MSARTFLLLLRNEWFKARKRLSLWLPLGFYAGIAFLMYGEDFFLDRIALPGVWSTVFQGERVIALFIFATLSFLMLTTMEFSWRTARQNVIDGLSKSQWFWGKALVIPLLGVMYCLVHAGIPGVMALIRTDVGAATGPLLPASVFAAAGGLLLGFACVTSLGFFLSLAIRNTGAAMGTWFLWTMPLEGGIIPELSRRYLHPDLPTYLPFQNSVRLANLANYDTAAYERLAAAAEQAGRAPPDVPNTGLYVVIAVVWIVLLLSASLVWFRRRDL